MADVAITKAPSASYLTAFTFEGRTGCSFKYSWTFSSDATSTSKANRVQSVKFYIEYQSGAFYTDPISTSKTSATITLSTNIYAPYLAVTPVLINSKGETTCTSRKLTKSFFTPPAPTISNVSFDYVDKTLTFTAGVSDAIENMPRLETFYQVECYVTNNGKQETIWSTGPTTLCGVDSDSTTSWTRTLTYSNVNLDDYTDAYVFVIAVHNWSMASNSSQATRYFMCVTQPPKPTITSDVYNINSGVELFFNWNTVDVDRSNPFSNIPYHCDTVTAQINYADDVKGLVESDWKDVGTALEKGQSYFVDRTDISPSLGQRIFFRLRSSYMEHVNYSEPYQLKNDTAFYKPSSGSETAEASVIEVVAVDTGTDGESLDVIIGYASDATYNACELGYSKDPNAWTSTDQPTTFEMPDSYWKDTTSKSEDHDKTSSIKISGLDEATTYYVRARRYLIDDKDNVHTLWSNIGQNDTSYDQSKKLKLTAPSVVPVGKECGFSWVFDDGLVQEMWGLYAKGAEGESDYRLTGGNNALTATSYIFDEAGTYEVYVKSNFETLECYKSDSVTLTVAEKPTVSFVTKPASTITDLPFSFSVKSNSASDTSLQVKIYASGASLWLPDGIKRQYSGDVVYQASGNNTLTCTLDKGCNLWDGCFYTVEVVGIANELESDPIRAEFSISYASKLDPLTSDNVSLTTDKDEKTATITLSNLADNITGSIYRTTKDGRSQLIKSGLGSGESITDHYAPFAKGKTLSYDVVVQSPYNQYASAECQYTMEGSNLRFDWGGKSVELPYNIEISDANDKQFEQQVYLDGSQKGSWGSSVVRQTTLSTNLIYLTSAEETELVRDLARYQGAVFVRTPLGQAFCANVEVSEISKNYDSKVVAVSFDCTEIDLTSDYMAG